MRGTLRAVSFRVFRVLLVAFAAYVAIVWAYRSGYAWLGYTVAVAILSAWLTFSVLRVMKSARARSEARWEAAIFDPSRRARAIAEVTRALQKVTTQRPASRLLHAKLSVLLAELRDADGDYAAAMAAVDGLSLESLAPLEVGLVRHTRAVTHLRGADAAGALRALEGREPSGDGELDQRLTLLEAYALIELHQVQQGLSTADAIASSAEVDASVVIEARVVRAAALDAGGRRAEALAVLQALGRDALTPLSELGHPRVRALAKEVLGGSAV